MIQPQLLEQEIRRASEAVRRVFAIDGDLEEADAEKLQLLFVDCVTTVNSRLRRCDELLRKGLRQEALQECETPPNFLDLVTELDIPEWDAWADYVRQFGIAPQPPLLIDVAAELNEAYAKAQTLEQVLRSHRLHALARSPLSTRLKVLRSIAERDPDNALWRDDINAYEAARLRQVGKELQDQIADQNLRAVASLREELESTEWETSPPQALVTRAIKAHIQLVADDSRRQLVRLVPLIDQAFSSFDVSQAEQLREHWDRLAGPAQLGDNDELTLSVAQAFQWLDEEREKHDQEQGFRHALSELEAALDDESSQQGDLTKLMAIAERYEEVIPERVLRRFDQRIEAIELAERRRSRLIITASMLGVLLLVFAGAIEIWWQHRVNEVRGLQTLLETAAKSANYQTALETYEAQTASKPYLAADPGVQQALGSLRNKRTADEARTKELDEHIKAAMASIESQQWSGVDAANKELRDAKQIVHDDEKGRLAEAVRSVARVENKLQDEIDKSFNDDLKAVTSSLTNLDHLEAKQIDSLLAVVRDFQKRPRVSELARSNAQLDLIARKLEDRRTSLREGEQVRAVLDQIGRSIGQPNDFANALQMYLSERPNGSRANDFKKVIAEDLTYGQTFDPWDKIAAEWNSTNLADGGAAESASSTLQKLKEEYLKFPGVRAVVALEPYVASLAKRGDAERTRDELLGKSVFSMDCFRSNEEVFYCFADSVKSQDGSAGKAFNFQRLTNSTKLTDTSSKHVKAADLLGNDKTDSPQKAFRNKVVKEVLPNKKLSYEAQSCSLLYHLLKDEQMDPILQTQLLQVFSATLSDGSSILKEQLQSFQKAVATDDVDLGDQNWLSRDDSGVAKLKSTLRSMLQTLRDGDNSPRSIYVERVLPAYDRMVTNKPKLPRFQWVAVLLKDESGKWIFNTKEKSELPDVGQLYVYDAKDSKVNPFRLIGEIGGREMKLTTDSDLYEGRPVYCSREVVDSRD